MFAAYYCDQVRVYKIVAFAIVYVRSWSGFSLFSLSGLSGLSGLSCLSGLSGLSGRLFSLM